MVGYVSRRLLQSLGVLLGVSVIVFGLLHLTGDPTRLLLPLEAREEDVRQLRALLGLDDPLWVQYLRFLSRAVRGDFGLSFKHQVPALTLIAQTLPATLELTAAGLGLALVVAVPAGILAALRRNSLIDAICSVGVLLGQAMPLYWLGLLSSSSSRSSSAGCPRRAATGSPRSCCPPSRSARSPWPASRAWRAPACSKCSPRTMSAR